MALDPKVEGAPAGLVLAAGASERFGGTPKALAPIDGQPAVRRLVEVLLDAGVSRVGVVVGPDAERIAAAVTPLAEVIANPRWAEGRTGSVQAGLGWAGSVASLVLAPVDHPFVRSGTVRRLLDALDRDPMAVWVQPVYRGRGGHPVVLRHAVFAEVERLGAAEPLYRVARKLGVGLARVPTDDEGVLLGTDTLEEYRVGLAEFRRGPRSE